MTLAIWQKFNKQQPNPIVLEHLFNEKDVKLSNLTQDILFDLSHLGILSVKGPDAAKFLQGQLTCDIRELSPTQSRLGAHCNPKGRMLSSFRLFQQQDVFYLSMPIAMLPLAKNHLQKYAMFSKVSIEDQSENMLGISCAGPSINKLLRTVLSDRQLNIDEALLYNGLSVIRVPDQPSSYRYEIYGEPTAIFHLWEELNTLLPRFNNEIWQLLNINARVPTIYPETSGLFTPHMINFHLINGVSFNKGCYTGQEIVARMQYLGKLKQHLHRAWIQAGTTPRLGEDIFAADKPTQALGTIVNMIGNAETGFFMLTTLQDEAVAMPHLFFGAENNNYVKILT